MKQRVTVATKRPELMVACNKQLWPAKSKLAQRRFQRIAVAGGGVTDDQQRVAAVAIDLPNQVFRQQPRAGVIKVQIGGYNQSHRERDSTRMILGNDAD